MTMTYEAPALAELDHHDKTANSPRDQISDIRWHARSRCLGQDPDMFFDGGGISLKAKRICAECPVREQCLEYALLNNERFGIWGGLTNAERQALRKRRRAEAGLGPEPDDAYPEEPDDEESSAAS